MLSAQTLQVKAYSKPPPLVETVMAAVMTMMGRASDWSTAKKALGEGNFLTQVFTHLTTTDRYIIL